MFKHILNIDWRNKSIKNIIKGWSKLLINKITPPFILTPNSLWHIEQQKNVRKSICAICPLNKDNWCSTEIYALNIYDEEVNGCGCYLPAKWEVEEESCPRLLWAKMLNEEEWQKYIEEINIYYLDNKYSNEEDNDENYENKSN